MSDDVIAFKHAFCPECGPVQNTDEDACCLMCGADVIVGTMFDELMDAKETAEAQLCRVKEAVATVKGHVSNLWMKIDEILSSPSPCPHAAEVERLREARLGVDSDTQVFFYERDFYIFSNFSAFGLYWKNRYFETSEAAYQWEKFEDKDLRHSIIHATSAHDAFKIAEKNKDRRRPDWDDAKVCIMREILFAKADQHEYVRRKLLATGDRELIEDSWRDDFWGWGPKRDGQNTLGKLWMEVRADLRSRDAGVK